VARPSGLLYGFGLDWFQGMVWTGFKAWFDYLIFLFPLKKLLSGYGEKTLLMGGRGVKHLGPKSGI
jgi:hypothetical protein